jgi:hypothetical protein
MKTKLDYSVSKMSNAGKELGAMISKLLQYKSENPPVEDYDVQLFIKEELEKVGLKVKPHTDAPPKTMPLPVLSVLRKVRLGLAPV